MGAIVGETCWEQAVGPGFDLVPFLPSSGERIRLYEILLVEDGGGEYYGRVVAGEERNEDAGAEYLRREKAMFYDSGPRREDDFRLIRVHHLEVLGRIIRGEGGTVQDVAEPDVLPQTRAPVVRPDAADLRALLALPERGFHVGTVLAGQETDFRLDHRAPSRHLGLFGRPGTGKSHLGGVLLEEFVERRLPVVSFDVNGELVQAVSELGGLTLVPGDDFRVPIRFLDANELLAAAPRLTREQESITLDAFEDLRNDPARRDRFELPNLLNEITTVATTLGQPAVGQRAAARINRMRRDAILGDLPGRDGTVPMREPDEWASLFQRHPCINVFVGRLRGRPREIVVAALCRLLQRLRATDRVPPFALMLDEAHFFVPSGSHSTSTDVVRDFIRVGRHGPTGTVLISQSPSGVDRQVLLLVNTVFAFALTGDDVKAVQDFLADAPRELIRRLPTMRAGTCVVGAAKDIQRHALLIRVRERRTSHGAPTHDLAVEAETWRQTHSEDGAA
jgi:DNA helicase HerA-like ATPase